MVSHGHPFRGLLVTVHRVFSEAVHRAVSIPEVCLVAQAHAADVHDTLTTIVKAHPGGGAWGAPTASDRGPAAKAALGA